jgi:hypothetical protein
MLGNATTGSWRPFELCQKGIGESLGNTFDDKEDTLENAYIKVETC